MPNDELYRLFLGEMEHEDERREEYANAPFGWPGGKARSLKEILPHLPYRDAYIEHCGGSGVVMLNRHLSNLNVFNDRDAGVAAFFRCFRSWEDTKTLIQKVEMMIASRELFIWCKETWKNCDDPIERAARWYYIVRMSFSQKGVCFARATDGKYKNPLIAMLNKHLDAFPTIFAKVKNWQVENMSLFQSLKDYDKEGAVHYLDPNYWGVAKGTYEHEIRDTEHLQICETIMRGKGFYALSGYPNPVYDHPSLKWDQRITWDVPITMAPVAFHESNNKVGYENHTRGTAVECLWIKDHQNG